MNNKLQSTISLCHRAGFLLWGFDQVKEELSSNKVRAVFLACDLSQKSAKEVEFFCKKENIPVFELPLTKEQIGTALRKATGVLAVTEEGFARILSEQGKPWGIKREE